MMIKSAEERLAQYMHRFVDRDHPDWSAKRKGCVAGRARLAFQTQVTIELQVRYVLAKEPVITVDYPRYYGFALSVMARARRTALRDELKAEVRERVTKWSALGCRPEVLNRILVEALDLAWVLEDGPTGLMTPVRTRVAGSGS